LPPSRASAASAQGTLHLLDIGCGGGIFAESAARLPTTASVTAIDPSPELLKIAEAHKRRDPALVAGGKLTYLNMGIEALAARQASNAAANASDGAGSSAAPAKYDVVTIFEVLEHVSHPSTFLAQVLPHVKPGGWIVVSTIARTWASWVVTKLVAEDIVGIVPRGTHEWSKYINEEELRAWFGAREGWGSPRAMGVVYVPGLGWREVPGSEGVGNYFFAVRKMPE
jgi:ubiquinone biosynthesis O-methyltransferase